MLSATNHTHSRLSQFFFVKNSFRWREKWKKKQIKHIRTAPILIFHRRNFGGIFFFVLLLVLSFLVLLVFLPFLSFAGLRPNRRKRNGRNFYIFQNDDFFRTVDFFRFSIAPCNAQGVQSCVHRSTVSYSNRFEFLCRAKRTPRPASQCDSRRLCVSVALFFFLLRLIASR